MAITIGVVGAPTTHGLAQSLTKNSTMEKVTVKDASGKTKHAEMIDQVETISLEYVLTGNMPKEGDAITVDGTAYGVTSVSENQTNNGVHTGTIEAERYVEHDVKPVKYTGGV